MLKLSTSKSNSEIDSSDKIIDAANSKIDPESNRDKPNAIHIVKATFSPNPSPMAQGSYQNSSIFFNENNYSSSLFFEYCSLLFEVFLADIFNRSSLGSPDRTVFLAKNGHIAAECIIKKSLENAGLSIFEHTYDDIEHSLITSKEAQEKIYYASTIILIKPGCSNTLNWYIDFAKRTDRTIDFEMDVTHPPTILQMHAALFALINFCYKNTGAEDSFKEYQKQVTAFQKLGTVDRNKRYIEAQDLYIQRLEEKERIMRAYLGSPSPS
ncbi:hypothetical protein [Legionella impletisoli]|uniref:Uncharacterized protein n=1 Tax=Legionella impletisoli TaxID=343510 RepID=A0A917K084_9GAMM|nr:hypothetical protein [Legionella impletisoli]GGI93153.1 hypothetical protein GCM10007966_22150 [Legionella impletisoli]